MYCSIVQGRCGDPDANGTCLPVPAQCPDTVKPVCGCDGNTYRNRCEAARARVSIAHQGACAGTPCFSEECGGGTFCAWPVGVCEGEGGTCTPRPDACPDIDKPVCGCDGRTYGNECEAAAAGVSVRSEGECPEELPPDPVE